MFLLSPDIFAWDLAILLLMTIGLAASALSIMWLRRHRSSRRIVRLLVGFLGFFGFLVIAYGSFIEPQILVTTTYSVNFPLNDLKIAVVSDTHIGPYKGIAYLRRVVEKTNATEPDIILLAGDYFFTRDADISALEPLRELRSRYGVFAVLGNHDMGRSRGLEALGRTQQNRSQEIRSLFQSMTFTVLENNHRIVQTTAGRVAIAGIADTWTGGADTGESLRGIPTSIPTILIAHSPDVLLDNRSRQAHLIVTGHTHGGQVRLPFIGPVAPIPTRVGQRYDQGLFQIDDDTTLAITRGVGESSVRARLFAWPEVMVLQTK